VEVKISLRTSEHRNTCTVHKLAEKMCLFVFVLSFLSSVLPFCVLLFVFHTFLFLCLIISLCSLLISLFCSYLVTVLLLPFPFPSQPTNHFSKFCSLRTLYTSAYTACISQVPKELSNGHGELPISAFERSSRSEGLVFYLFTGFLSFVVYLTTLLVARIHRMISE
jgi:hypothetical protein